MNDEKFILQWSDNYQLIFQKSRLISQIPTFIIAVIAICEIGWIFSAILKADNVAWEIVISALAFQSAIAFFGMLRFFLLFSESRISFWLSQIAWLICFSVLFIDSGNRNHITSYGVYFYYPLYILFSSIRQIATLIISFLRVGKNK